MTLAVIAIVLLVVVVLAGLWVVGAYNGLIRLKAMVDEGWSGIDVQLKRRYDLIPNLVAVVKQYSFYEQNVLENVTKYRSVAMNATSIEGKAQAEAGLAGALKTLFAVAENYPNLKANENFMSLQKSLSDIENDVQLARRYYNGTVRNYLATKKTFPINIVSSVGGFTDVPYFELTASEEKEVPQVKF